MPNLNAANFSTAGTNTKRTLGARLDDWINVKEFGAVGDGIANDTAAIQAAFDYAYGSLAAPKGHENFGSFAGGFTPSAGWTLKTVFFPAGEYKVSATLTLPITYGISIIGAGSQQTRIFFSGSEHIPADNPSDDFSALLECRMCWEIYMQGLTLDAGLVQKSVMRSMHWPAEGPPSSGNSDGSDGVYIDLHLTNAVQAGFYSFGVAMGSERTWINCRFTNCQWGHCLAQANALNHSFYNCVFANNKVGMRQTTGGQGVVFGCRFENNGALDIVHKQNSLEIIGCRSTSRNFLTCVGTVIGCTHSNVLEGMFWTPSYFNLPGDTGPMTYLPDPYWTEALGCDGNAIVCKGNTSTNGVVYSRNAAAKIYFRGNTFANAGYLTEYTSVGAIVVQNV